MALNKRDYSILVDEIPWVRSRLLRWCRSHSRNYPWRNTRDPYCVLIAEIMLQRTRADQVAPIYTEFITRYPDVPSLANADEKSLKKLLWPLGLHSRAGVLYKMAKDIRDRFDGKVPFQRDQLRWITGVGDYVAGAVLSVGFGRPEGIVDANVVRVFSRFTGMQFSGEPRRSPEMVALAQIYADSRVARKANLALLDHAALVCRSRNPLCKTCPLRNHCDFYERSILRPASLKTRA